MTGLAGADLDGRALRRTRHRAAAGRRRCGPRSWPSGGCSPGPAVHRRLHRRLHAHRGRGRRQRRPGAARPTARARDRRRRADHRARAGLPRPGPRAAAGVAAAPAARRRACSARRCSGRSSRSSWVPCVGPDARRGARAGHGRAAQTGRAVMLAVAYCLGLGLPFVAFGLGFRRLLGVLPRGPPQQPLGHPDRRRAADPGRAGAGHRRLGRASSSGCGPPSGPAR